ncbi:hypothetical protein [Congregicoccus parvus]|uniref:hypothetical protein n=1 Tax=Congregicoccus parvus TaxID=3081749 RepID=UPI003FA57392
MPSPSVRSFRILALTGFLTAVPSVVGVPEGWFPWPYVEPVAGSALDSSALNHKPAGSRGPIVVRDSIFVTSDDGARLRFWGCNLSSNEAFPPDAATAERVARRLALGGVNIARLHHLDNPWSVDSAGSLWTPGSQDSIRIDPAQLDKLHRLVAALKAEGVYSNVNLKVSRTHTEEDGFPASIAQLPGFHKRVDYYSRRHVEMQKDFARRLLSPKNPYTGLSLAEDPAIAVVEINNENSLLGLRTRDIGAGLHLLPEPFRGELQEMWNGWLAARYATDDALRTAWSTGATPVGSATTTPASRWFADAQPGNDVRIESPHTGAVHITIGPGDGVRWRSAAFLDHLRLVENATYTLSFSARADATRPVEIVVGRDDPLWRTDKWRSRGLRSVVTLEPEWREHRMTFVAHSIVDVGSRLTVIAGHQTGTVELRDVRLESGSSTAGLRQGQSPRAGDVPIPTDPTPAQWNDWLQFLVETEQAYVDEMRRFLIDELGVRAPIVCTQANYGGIAGLVREQASDFIDAHCYWQHPDFGGSSGVWNTGHYTINNTPQIGELSARWFGEFGALAQLRVAGKPFTVTELDHPAPSDYAAEMYPFTATFAGLQDWDGLYTFDMVGIGLPAEEDTGALLTFFDQHHHPAKWGFGPFATRVFRHGLIPPLEATRELHVSAPFWAEANHLDVLWLKHRTAQDIGFLTDRLSVHEDLLPADRPTRIQSSDTQTNAGSSARLVQARRGQVYLVDAPAASAFVGYVGDDTLATSRLEIATDSFGLQFAAVTAVALDERPLEESSRVLVTLAARAENQGSVWNAARSTVGDVWGKGGPPVAERVPATIRVHSATRRAVYALSHDGSHAAQVEASWDEAARVLEFSTRTGPATLHYELVPTTAR